MTVTDALSVLAFLASPALIAFVSKEAEGWGWFQSVTPNGKLAIIGGASVLLAMASLALTTFLTGHPDVLGSIDPYVKVALPIINFVVSQITHGSGQPERAIGKKKGTSEPRFDGGVG